MTFLAPKPEKAEAPKASDVKPPPAIDEARTKIDQQGIARKRRGRAANILVERETSVSTGPAAPGSAARALTGN